MTDDSYEPIDCAIHDVLEASAVRRAPCRIRLADSTDVVRELVTTIDDIFARGGVEYAVLGDGSTVRLDRILDVRPT